MTLKPESLKSSPTWHTHHALKQVSQFLEIPSPCQLHGNSSPSVTTPAHPPSRGGVASESKVLMIISGEPHQHFWQVFHKMLVDWLSIKVTCPVAPSCHSCSLPLGDLVGVVLRLGVQTESLHVPQLVSCLRCRGGLELCLSYTNSLILMPEPSAAKP